MELIKDLGEHELLRRLRKYCHPNLVGDDGAVFKVSEGMELVVSSDMLVENVHFSDRTTPPYMVGWRSVAANLSDLAAMGAYPLGITVALSLSPQTPWDWLESLYQGMKDCLDRFDTFIIGGDLTGGKVSAITEWRCAIAITALGEVKANQKILRNTAQTGDVIVTTGNHGLSRAGLEILLYPEKYQDLQENIKQKLILAHQKPQPRLDVIPRLHPYAPITGMDSSDGLADAIIQICQQSNKGARIYLDKIAPCAEILHITDDATALKWTLFGGEDFELVLCLSPEKAEKLIKGDRPLIKRIGEITEEKPIILIDNSNPDSEVLLDSNEIFNHF
ncbi:thiamine-phosphate kinase [Cyanobacterium stanieri LEGE 03274]|uniref:Thiamine-monophosphate kinase n=1 Tax=Cyanobacterium stanieri LEGE 03274 TaxID=1828756 RepID=A0ABR9V109_9CHRO|nr:thiamine-phosphate kinase [Cyanobacterium stanieri]MBE9221259.1 thiamine-phosphate kinase [Cyanobacterium stanieri LEGE 03274]